MITLVVVLPLDMAAAVSFDIYVISCWITGKEEITFKKLRRASVDVLS